MDNARDIEFYWRGNKVIRTMLMFFLSLCTLLSGCGVNKQEFILNQLDVSKIPDCYEANRNIFGEFTGCVFKCGDIIFYSQYTYKQQKYEPRSSDGLYITDGTGSSNYKLADGIICSIVVREDGVYYLKRNEKGKVYLYNWDLYRYSFETGKSELIISDCTSVQYSEDSVYYCRQYLGDKRFYIEHGLPLDLDNEGKIVKHSLLTGEEELIAQVEGGIYNFLMADGIIAFSGGGGNAYEGGQDIYICSLDGSGLQKLTKNAQGYINIKYADDKCLIYSDTAGYHRMALDTEEVVWSYPWEKLDQIGALAPVALDGDLFFCMKDSQYLYDKIIRLDTGKDFDAISLIDAPQLSKSLYVFAGKLYASDYKYTPGMSGPAGVLKEVIYK